MQQGGRLTPDDYADNTARAIFKGIPYIGELLHQLFWGPEAIRHERRIEQTLTEMAEAIHESGSDARVRTEEFGRLLERLIPSVARATNEDKRARLRDLLVNAASLESGDRRWEEAGLARDIVESLEGPALAILAALGRTPEAYLPRRGAVPVPNVQILSQPVPQVLARSFGWSRDEWEGLGLEGIELAYRWDVLEEWIIRLKERRLLLFHTGDARGGFGGVYLTGLGEMVVTWATQGHLPGVGTGAT
jgi:hypothetical protein